MLLGIASGIIALLAINKVARNVQFNQMMTKDLNKAMRRKLLLRYGPFKIDDYVVRQNLSPISKTPIIPLDIIKTPSRAA